MKGLLVSLLLVLVSIVWASSVTAAPPAVAAVPTKATAYNDAGFYEGETGLTPSERAGREIGYKASTGNDW